MRDFKAHGADDVIAKPLNALAFEVIVHNFISARNMIDKVAGGGGVDKAADLERIPEGVEPAGSEKRVLRVLVVDDSKATRYLFCLEKDRFLNNWYYYIEHVGCITSAINCTSSCSLGEILSMSEGKIRLLVSTPCC